jgi:elongation factor Ts
MAITTEDIKKLRDLTGISVMQCKKALEEADGDMDKAVVVLKKKSKDIAEKKGNRDLGAGVVEAYIHGTHTTGTLVELACETDFVANNEEFRALAYDIAMHVAAANPQFISEDEITEDAKNTAREVFAKEAADKPSEMQEQIIQGKLDSYFKDGVLLKQAFVKDPQKSIQQLCEEATQKFGERIAVTRFTRFSIV